VLPAPPREKADESLLIAAPPDGNALLNVRDYREYGVFYRRCRAMQKPRNHLIRYAQVRKQQACGAPMFFTRTIIAAAEHVVAMFARRAAMLSVDVATSGFYCQPPTQ